MENNKKSENTVTELFNKYLKSLDWDKNDPVQLAMYLRLHDACRNILKETKEMYSECFEQFMPIDKWDEATIFLSTYKNGLAQDFQKKEDKINHKK